MTTRHQTPFENRHAQALPVGEVVAVPVPGTGSCQQRRCESSALHRIPIAACLRGSAVGYFRHLGPTLDTSMLQLTASDVIDGGNSNYKDTLRRAKLLASMQIHYVDCGTSGTPIRPRPKRSRKRRTPTTARV